MSADFFLADSLNRGIGLDAELPFHALADIFPLIEGDDFLELCSDVHAHGVRETIKLYEGKILDGRNRYRAARKTDISCRFEAYTGDDPVGYVISLNLRRRHLTASQRAMAAVKLTTWRLGDNQHTGNRIGSAKLRTQKTAADSLDVSERLVTAASKVVAEGSDGLQGAVTRGDLSVTIAADIAGAKTADEQEAIVARGEKEILKAASDIRKAKAEQSRSKRIARIAVIAAGNSDLDTAQRFPVIYADPPWRYEQPHMGVTNRGIENHYPTMALEDICALPVADLATPDAVLYLWITAPHTYCSVPQLLAAWDFSFRAEIVWDKEVAGLGFWTRGQHEKLLICSRGKFPSLHGAHCPPSIYRERRGKHSAKPAYFYELIEKLHPELPKIELFARQPRDGWSRWGNQAEAPPALAEAAE